MEGGHIFSWGTVHTWDSALLHLLAGLGHARLLAPLCLLFTIGTVLVVGACIFTTPDGFLSSLWSVLTLPFNLGYGVWQNRASSRRWLLRNAPGRASYLGLLGRRQPLGELIGQLRREDMSTIFGNIEHVFAVMSDLEILAVLAIACWALVAFTPDFVSPGPAGRWPFRDAFWWALMQAAFMWRARWALCVQAAALLSGTYVCVKHGLFWVDRRRDLLATRFVRAVVSGKPIAPPACVTPLPSDSKEVAEAKSSRLGRAFNNILQPPTVWERWTIPQPTLSGLLYVTSTLLAALMFGGVTWLEGPRRAVDGWWDGLWSLRPAAWGCTVLVPLAAWLLARLLTARQLAAWRGAYELAKWESSLIYPDGAQGRRASEQHAVAATLQQCGPYPKTWPRLRGWAYNALRVALGLLWGLVLVQWAMHPATLPAVVRRAGGGAAVCGGKPDVQQGLLASLWEEVRFSANVNLLAARAWRRGGLPGVQVALEALCAARSPRAVGVEGKRTAALARDALRDVQLWGTAGLRWRVGGEWALGEGWERMLGNWARAPPAGGVVGRVVARGAAGSADNDIGGSEQGPAASGGAGAKAQAASGDPRDAPDPGQCRATARAPWDAACDAAGSQGGADPAAPRKAAPPKKPKTAQRTVVKPPYESKGPRGRDLVNMSIALVVVLGGALLSAWLRLDWSLLMKPDKLVDAVSSSVKDYLSGRAARKARAAAAAAAAGPRQRRGRQRQPQPGQPGRNPAHPGKRAEAPAAAPAGKGSVPPAAAAPAGARPGAAAAAGAAARGDAAPARDQPAPPPQQAAAAKHAPAPTPPPPAAPTPAPPPNAAPASAPSRKANRASRIPPTTPAPPAAPTSPTAPAPATAPEPPWQPAQPSRKQLRGKPPAPSTTHRASAAAPARTSSAGGDVAPAQPAADFAAAPAPAAFTSARGQQQAPAVGFGLDELLPPPPAAAAQPTATPNGISPADGFAAAAALEVGPRTTAAAPPPPQPQPSPTAQRPAAPPTMLPAAAAANADTFTAAVAPILTAPPATASVPAAAAVAATPPKRRIAIPVPVPGSMPAPNVAAEAAPTTEAVPPAAKADAQRTFPLLGLNPALAQFLGRTAPAPGSAADVSVPGKAAGAPAQAVAAGSPRRGARGVERAAGGSPKAGAAAGGGARADGGGVGSPPVAALRGGWWGGTPGAPAAPPAAARGGLWGDAPDVDPNACVRCLVAPRQVGMLHGLIAHLSLCRACGEGFAVGDPCPLCGEEVTRVLNIF